MRNGTCCGALRHLRASGDLAPPAPSTRAISRWLRLSSFRRRISRVLLAPPSVCGVRRRASGDIPAIATEHDRELECEAGHEDRDDQARVVEDREGERAPVVE